MPSRRKPVEVSEEQIRQTAAYLIMRYGRGAELEAAMEVDKFIAKKDSAGERIWMRVLNAIKEIQQPKGRDILH